MLRRNFIRMLAGSALLSLLGVNVRADERKPRYRFVHGVASGDPLADRVILWTRVSGAKGEKVRVRWWVAEQPDMTAPIASGRVTTDARRDYTVKVDARGLPAGRKLYYRFAADGVESPLGTTQTLPEGPVEAVGLAVVSCSNHPYGYFHAYREIARRDDITAVVHLGDYIYEYGMGGFATERAETLDRIPDPPHELLTLADYRRRHAQYRTDPDLQAMHAAHPFIAVWDDHEIADDAWRDGAKNHNNDETVDEGGWGERRQAAIKAWFEWLPVRGEPAGKRTRIFREFRFGDLLHLLMLDTRHYGRNQQPDYAQTDGTPEAMVAMVADEDRQMLGRRQQRWVRKRLRRSDTTWQALGQQVLVAPLVSPDLEPLLDLEKPSRLSIEELKQYIGLSKTGLPVLLDTWDGYPAARARLLQDIGRYGRNTVVLSGDLHTHIAADLKPAPSADAVAVEMMAGSVTSPGFAEHYLPERRPGTVQEATLANNPHLRFMDTASRGWLEVTFTRAECTGQWHLLDSVATPTYSSRVGKRLAVSAGNIAAGLHEA